MESAYSSANKKGIRTIKVVIGGEGFGLRCTQDDLRRAPGGVRQPREILCRFNAGPASATLAQH